MKSWSQSAADSANPPADYVTLNAPAGSDGDLVSHGDEGWMVDPMTMTVSVPVHAVEHLIKNVGFWMARTKAAGIPAGMTQIFHPDGPRAFGFRGVSYEPDGDGVNTVPVEAVHEMAPFGFLAGRPIVGAASSVEEDPRDAEIAQLKDALAANDKAHGEEIARLEAEIERLNQPQAPQPPDPPEDTATSEAQEAQEAQKTQPTVTLAQVGIDTAGAATLADAGIAKP